MQQEPGTPRSDSDCATLDQNLALVIDDDACVFQFVSATLAQHGISAANFKTAQTALAALDSAHPALIFLDVALLESDAIDVLGGLGARRYRGTVHLMSGGRPSLLEAVRRIGMRHGIRLGQTLNKPVAREAIADVIAGTGLPIPLQPDSTPEPEALPRPVPIESPGSASSPETNAADWAEPPQLCDDDAARPAVWLLCRAAAHLFAIDIEHVIETMRALPIETVSGMPRYVRGLCVIRGEPLPVVDTGLLLAGQSTLPRRLVCIRTGRRTIALIVEDIVGIRTIAAGDLCELPPLLRDSASISAVGTRDAELLVVLRTARIVPDDLLDRLDIAGAVA